MSDSKYYHSGTVSDESIWGDGYIDWLPQGESVWGKKCTCGCWKTYGEDCPLDYHSDWCELKEGEKK